MLCQGLHTLQPRQSKIFHGMVVLLLKMMPRSKFPGNLQRAGSVALTHFVFHANLTPEESAKADKQRADKLENRHPDEERRRRDFIEGCGEPELPSVVPMGTTMDTTGCTFGGVYP